MANEATKTKNRYNDVLKDPHHAFKEWFELVKPGGHIITIVPDEDLYEQGLFPSRFNSDHKFTFTISKSKSWSPKSVNILDLVKEVKGELKYLKLQEDHYDRRLYCY